MNADPRSFAAAIRSDAQAKADEQFARSATPTFTCIIPALNEAKNLACLIPKLNDVLRTIVTQYSILVIDDGSTDDTTAVAIALADTYPVRVLQLSRNFGKESAIVAGLDHADTDIVMLMDADCQHPVELVPVFYAYWQQGYDMVYGVCCDRSDESAIKRRFTKWFYSVLSRTASIPIVPNAGDFRLFDRRVVEALRALPERTRFMKGLYCWVGFRSIGVPYRPALRHAGKSQFTFRCLFKLALNGLTSFTDMPLKIWSAIGFAVAMLSTIYGVFIGVRTLIFGIDVPGWATLTVAVTFLGGLQLFSIGVLGEYIGRIFSEVKQRPVYLVGRYFNLAPQNPVVQRNQIRR